MLAYHSKRRSGASSSKFLPALHTNVAWQVAADMKQTSNRGRATTHRLPLPRRGRRRGGFLRIWV